MCVTPGRRRRAVAVAAQGVCVVGGLSLSCSATVRREGMNSSASRSGAAASSLAAVQFIVRPPRDGGSLWRAARRLNKGYGEFQF